PRPASRSSPLAKQRTAASPFLSKYGATGRYCTAQQWLAELMCERRPGPSRRRCRPSFGVTLLGRRLQTAGGRGGQAYRPAGPREARDWGGGRLAVPPDVGARQDLLLADGGLAGPPGRGGPPGHLHGAGPATHAGGGGPGAPGRAGPRRPASVVQDGQVNPGEVG